MIVIAGHVKIALEHREAAIAAARDAMEASNREPGCHAYVFSEDLATPGTFHLFEEWEDQRALDAHFQTPHMAEFQSKMPGLGILEMKVQRYEVSSVGPVGG